MHDLDDSINKVLPFAPGEGPFHIKGTAYRGHMAYVLEHVPGGIEGMNEGFRDKRLVEFFKQPFLTGSWYDINPLVSAGYVCARQCRKSFSEFLRMRSRYQAEKDIHGIYKLLLKLASPSMVVSRLPALQAQYLDFLGKADAKMVGPKHAQMRRSQLPEMLCNWFSVVNETYTLAALGTAGAKNLRITMHPHEPDGEVHGVKAVTFCADVVWD